MDRTTYRSQFAKSVCHVKDRVEGAILVDRTTRYGNPFRIGPDGTREEVISKYRNLLWEKFQDAPRETAQWLEPLAGARLACHCSPEACHGEVLAAAALFAEAVAAEVEAITGTVIPDAYAPDEEPALYNPNSRVTWRDAFETVAWRAENFFDRE